MHDDSDDIIRKRAAASSTPDEEEAIVVEGEERPIVVEDDGQPTDAAYDDWPLIEDEEEQPVFAGDQAPAPRMDRPAAPASYGSGAAPAERAVFVDSHKTRPRPAMSAAAPTTTKQSRWKTLLPLVGGGVVVALVVGMLFRAVSAGGGTTTPQAQATPVVATPTTATDVASEIPQSTAGALILLNPGVVSQGSILSVMGTGFKANAAVNLAVMTQTTNKVLTTVVVKTDKRGSFSGASITVPKTLSSGNFIVQAQDGKASANAVATVAGGAPQVKLGKMVTKPGDVVGIAAHGFSPGETINIYWNSMGGKPVGVLQADSAGGVGLASVQVPFGAVGTNTFLFVGTKSQSLAAANVLLLSLYPSVAPSSYMIKADNTVKFSGKGFGPGERVFAFLNNTNDLPIAVIQTNASGAFAGAGNIAIPFSLKGKQKVIFMGEQSHTTSTVAFTVQPYMPQAQASTYGGYPGTTVTFYGAGFARNEVVHVYVGSTVNNAGTMVSCFRTDDRGDAAAAGSYRVPGDAQAGALTFSLTGAKSGSTAKASMTISAAPSPVNVPAQPPFTCPLDANP